MDRREFAVKVARGGLLGALAVMSGILISRNQVRLENDCSGGSHCRNCRKLNSCDLPEAEITRNNGRKG